MNDREKLHLMNRNAVYTAKAIYFCISAVFCVLGIFLIIKTPMYFEIQTLLKSKLSIGTLYYYRVSPTES